MGADISGVGALAWVAATSFALIFLQRAESVATNLVSIDGSDALTWSVSGVY